LEEEHLKREVFTTEQGATVNLHAFQNVKGLDSPKSQSPSDNNAAESQRGGQSQQKSSSKIMKGNSAVLSSSDHLT